MKLTIVVPRKPCSVNAAYKRAQFSLRRGAGGGTGFVLTTEGRDFKDAVRVHAFAAARSAKWPKPESVKRVSLVIETWNSPRHDVDAPSKLTQDAMEGVIYANDRAVSEVTLRKNADGGRARVEVTIELLEVV